MAFGNTEDFSRGRVNGQEARILVERANEFTGMINNEPNLSQSILQCGVTLDQRQIYRVTLGFHSPKRPNSPLNQQANQEAVTESIKR